MNLIEGGINNANMTPEERDDFLRLFDLEARRPDHNGKQPKR